MYWLLDYAEQENLRQRMVHLQSTIMNGQARDQSEQIFPFIGRKSRAIARTLIENLTDENAVIVDPGGLLVNAILLDRNAFRVTHGQTLEEDIQRRLEVLVLLLDLGTPQQFHNHAEVLFLRWSLMQQIQHKSLEQCSLRFFPKRVGALRMGRRGVLDQVGDQLQHLFVIPHIPEWVIAEGRIRVEQIEHPYFISRSFEKAASLAQNFSFGICDDHGTASFQHIGNCIRPGLAGAGAAHNEYVGIVLVLIAIHTDADVARHQEVWALGIAVTAVEFFGVPPAGRAVFLPGARVTVFTGRGQDNHGIQAGEDQQEARGLVAPLKGKRLCQHLIAGVQQTGQIHTGLPAHGQSSCDPPNQRKRQQPDPPRGWCFLQSAFCRFVAGFAALVRHLIKQVPEIISIQNTSLLIK